MKTLKNNLVKTLAVLTLLFTASQTANAALIQQDILVDSPDFGLFQLGTIELDVNPINAGLQSTFDGGVTLTELTIFGVGLTGLDVFDFEAIVDTNNLFAGIEFLAFDIMETVYADNWSYQLIFDSFAGPGFVDIFDSNFDLVTFGDVFLSDATVVSEPSILALFGLALAAFGMRRKLR